MELNCTQSIKEIFSEKNEYVIPLYQRSFTWGKTQIVQLLHDIYDAKRSGDDYFLGTLTVKRRLDNKLEVIDGQQRLTVLSLIKRVLSDPTDPYKNRLFYDSRPEVSKYLSMKEAYDKLNSVPSSVLPLVNATEFIQTARLDAEQQSTLITEDEGFASYFNDKVKLVVVDIPEDTDVAAYFEIMNNRGQQLQKHEILKAKLMEKIEDISQRNEFEKIWTACSQMDRPIQKNFTSPNDKKSYFGDNYTSFKFYELGSNKESDNAASENYDITKLSELVNTRNNGIKGKGNNGKGNNGTETGNDSSEFRDTESKNAIIDFPNFLMHVLKAQKDEFSLDSKFLLESIPESVTEAEVKDFIRKLFFARVCFDRFVIFTIPDDNKEDGFKWALEMPFYSGNSKYFKNTFSSKHQQRIIRAQSLLQVSFSSREYKNWLFELIKYFFEFYKDKEDKLFLEDIGDQYLKYIDAYLYDYYVKLVKKLKISFKGRYSQGTNTPHFLLHFIDYLYWVTHERGTDIPDLSDELKKKIQDLKDFDFKYWNSVEHHLAKEYSKDVKELNVGDEQLNLLGNLYLISRSTNSRLSDRSPKEKVDRFKSSTMGMNRQVIYKITTEKGWTGDEIVQHYKEVVELLENAHNILDVEKKES